LLGWPPRFWKRAASKASHPFFNHPLLSRHGGTLAAAAKQRAVERAKEKEISGSPSLVPRRVSRELARLRHIEAGRSGQLIELAKRATSMVWGIPMDRLDANLSATITLDDGLDAETLRGRILALTAVGYACVAARDGAVDVVARATNWYFLAKELVRGTAELICLHGLAGLSDDTYQAVIRHADKIEYEPWMLQTGGELWRRLLGVLPTGTPVQRMLMRLARLPAEELEHIMLAVIEDPGSTRMDAFSEKPSLFGARIVKPSLTRRPSYDIIEPHTREYRFDCTVCGSQVRLDLDAILSEDGRADSILGPENAAAIRAHFEFNMVGKSHDGGWPRLHVERCSRCRTRYLVYVGVKEPSNSRFLVTVQGITQLVTE
jgi:hypothetical protein